VLPVILLVLTCLSTFWAGAAIVPGTYLLECQRYGTLLPIRQVLWAHYQDGLIFMAAAVSIVFAHEMGHFVATLYHRVPASLPYFLPMPATPFGTMGAVIRMEGGVANRLQVFDIGIAGPIAGLLVAVPVMCIGLQHLDLQVNNGHGSLALPLPLGAALLSHLFGTKPWPPMTGFPLGHLEGNPWFMAGWFGFLITGLNMMPVSQLDGGHVAYCLFTQKSRWISRGILLSAIVYMIVRQQFELGIWVLIILFLGPYHPPTTDDRVRLGAVRYLLGLASLTLPVLCLPMPIVKMVSLIMSA
jgi:membrane-associated protease RseP (regulator of RpoE activity)